MIRKKSLSRINNALLLEERCFRYFTTRETIKRQKFTWARFVEGTFLLASSYFCLLEWCEFFSCMAADTLQELSWAMQISSLFFFHPNVVNLITKKEMFLLFTAFYFPPEKEQCLWITQLLTVSPAKRNCFVKLPTQEIARIVGEKSLTVGTSRTLKSSTFFHEPLILILEHLSCLLINGVSEAGDIEKKNVCVLAA